MRIRHVFVLFAVLLVIGSLATSAERTKPEATVCEGVRMTLRADSALRDEDPPVPNQFTASFEPDDDYTGWYVLDNSDTDGGDYVPGYRACYPHTGQTSMAMTGWGDNGKNIPCEGPYPNEAVSWLTYGPFSLENATAATLTYHLYGRSEYQGGETCETDYVLVASSGDGGSFAGTSHCGNWTAGTDGNGYYQETLDLSSRLGDDSVWIGFVFVSNASDTDMGFYIDDVNLAVEEPATATATPTAEPQTTPGALQPEAYLPILRTNWARTQASERVTTSGGGVLTNTNGVSLYVPPDAVSPQTGGADSEVTLTIQAPAELPAALPDWVNDAGLVVRFGPEALQFAYPVAISLPFPGVSDLAQLSLLYWDAVNAAWQRLPMSFGADSANAVTASVYQLGTFVVVSSDPAPAPSSLGGADLAAGSIFWYDGGLRIVNDSLVGGATGIHKPVIVYLKVESFTPKYAWQTGYAPGTVLCTGWDITGFPADETIHFLSQGTYEFCVSVTEYYIPPISTGRKWMYADTVSVTINEPAHNRYQVFPRWEGVTAMPGLDPSKWSQTTPCTHNPSYTVPWCTGDLQCTLSWVNRQDAVADYDLHLYGPNGLHVYWANKTPAGGAVKLDRDHRYDLGQGIENICNIAAMPAGSYRVELHNYRQYVGSPPLYHLTVINNGIPQSWTGTLADDVRQDLYTFTR